MFCRKARKFFYNKYYILKKLIKYILKTFCFVISRLLVGCKFTINFIIAFLGLEDPHGDQPLELNRLPCLNSVYYYHFVGLCGAFCGLKWRFWRAKMYFSSLNCSDCFFVIFFSFYFLNALQKDINSNSA